MEYKSKVIPVITGTTGTISKLFRKYLGKYLENPAKRNYR
jgi:RNase P/RNase MRP subunit POP5